MTLAALPPGNSDETESEGKAHRFYSGGSSFDKGIVLPNGA